MVEANLTSPREAAEAPREADDPRNSLVVRFGPDKPLKLDAGVELAPFQIAYKTYGTLNAERTNAVLVCHALTGDQHVASDHPVTGKGGWWETMVGPGKPIDTERYFVICPNVVGGCMGTTGPSSTNPKTGKPWGLEFPVITIRDMVRAQAMLLDHLGIETLFSVAGGSMGGMQVLQWAASYPHRVFSALPIACATRHSAQNIAFHEVGRQAIMADPEWRRGRYHLEGTIPRRGLAVARMGAHITYLVRRRAAPQIRPQIPGPRESDVFVRRGFRGRILSAPPGHFVRRAFRRQFLSLSHARHGLFRSRGRLRRRAGQCLQGHADALLRDFVHQRLAVPDLGVARDRACAQCRRARASRSPRSSPTRATTPSCSTSRNCSPSCAASSTAPARHAALLAKTLTAKS